MGIIIGRAVSIFLALLSLAFAWLALGFMGSGYPEFDGYTLIFALLATGCAILAVMDLKK